MRVALLQCRPQSDSETAIVTLSQALFAAAAGQSEVLVAPELFLPGYSRDDIALQAKSQAGEVHERLSDLCARAGCGLVIGYAERDGEHLFNSAVAFDAEGRETAHYRKIQLYGPRETALFHPGASYCTFDLSGQKAALLICYDVEFAPHVAALAAAGVKIILVPTANMMPFTHVADFTVPAMAANHGLAIIYANWCGNEGDLTYTGGSVIVGPHGDIVARAGQEPALLIANLPNRNLARLSTQLRDFRPIQAP